MKLKLKSSFGEFITVFDDNDNEIVDFQSDEVEKLEDSICNLLEYLKVKR